MSTPTPTAEDRFVILRGILTSNRFDRFFTSYTPGEPVEDICRVASGDVAYEVLGFAASVAEAQKFLYGRTIP